MDLQAREWSVSYGREYWRKPAPNVETTHISSAGVNIGDAIERVQHAIRETSEDGNPQLTADNYQVVFDDSGFRLSPRLDSEGGTSTMTFRTESISLGGGEIPAAVSDPRIVGNTAQRLLDAESGIVEHCETRRDGVEVTWMIPSRPNGEGDLVLRTRISGMSYSGSMESGHHFADSSGTAKARVGSVTLVDAEGTHWDAPSWVNSDTLVTKVPASVLDTASYPLAVDPIVGPEFEVPGVYLVSKEGNNHGIALASDGSNYLVVWVNQLRRGSPGEIWATRTFLTSSFPAVTEEAFAGRPDTERPYRKGLKTGPDGAYIELAFLTPEVGARHHELLQHLFTSIGYELRIKPEPNQIALIALVRKLRAVGGHLSLSNLNPEMQEVIRATKLDSLLAIEPE